MPITAADLVAVQNLLKREAVEIAKGMPPKFGFVLIVYEDSGTGWTSYTMSGTPERASRIMEETVQNFKTAPPLIDPIRGNMINLGGGKQP